VVLLQIEDNTGQEPLDAARPLGSEQPGGPAAISAHCLLGILTAGRLEQRFEITIEITALPAAGRPRFANHRSTSRPALAGSWSPGAMLQQPGLHLRSLP